MGSTSTSTEDSETAIAAIEAKEKLELQELEEIRTRYKERSHKLQKRFTSIFAPTYGIGS